MSSSSVAPSFSMVLSSCLDRLACSISDAPNTRNNAIVYDDATDCDHFDYFATLSLIYKMTNDLFLKISHCATTAGFSDVQRFHASPRGRRESIVLGVIGENARIVEVILLRNPSGTLLNAEGDLFEGEDIIQAADRAANEEFKFSKFSWTPITVEFQNGRPVSHSVTGVNLFIVTTEKAADVALANQLSDCALVRLPVEEFLEKTDNDTHPVDHGCVRKHIAKFIRCNNSSYRREDFRTHDVTESDCEVARKAKIWIDNVHVHIAKVLQLKNIITEFNAREFAQPVEGEVVGPWRSPENRDRVQEAAQRVVDAIVAKLLPAWIYQGTNGPLEACQVKVQEAVPVMVNWNFIPSFLTERQFLALQMSDSDYWEPTFIIQQQNRNSNGNSFDVVDLQCN